MSMQWNITIVMASMMLMGMGNLGMHLLVRQRHTLLAHISARAVLPVWLVVIVYTILYDACRVIRAMGIMLCYVGVWWLGANLAMPRLAGVIEILLQLVAR